jgi:hypothetical protein
MLSINFKNVPVMTSLSLPALWDANLNRLVLAIQNCCLNKEPTKEEVERFVLLSDDNAENKTLIYDQKNIGRIRLEVNDRLVSRWVFTPNF